MNKLMNEEQQKAFNLLIAVIAGASDVVSQASSKTLVAFLREVARSANILAESIGRSSESETEKEQLQ